MPNEVQFFDGTLYRLTGKGQTTSGISYREFKLELPDTTLVNFTCWAFDCIDYDKYCRVGVDMTVAARLRPRCTNNYLVEWMEVLGAPEFKSSIIVRKYGSRAAYQKALAEKKKKDSVLSATIGMVAVEKGMRLEEKANQTLDSLQVAMAQIENKMNGSAAGICKTITEMMAENARLKKEVEMFKLLAKQNERMVTFGKLGDD